MECLGGEQALVDGRVGLDLVDYVGVARRPRPSSWLKTLSDIQSNMDDTLDSKPTLALVRKQNYSSLEMIFVRRPIL